MSPLFSHQKSSLDFLSALERSLDTSDPGTGKTRVAIEAFAIRRLKGAGCCLVIAPKSLLRAAWADDFAKFAPMLKVAVATAENRDKAFAENADVYITNTDAVKWLLKQPPGFWTRFKDGMLVVDEASAFKHHTSGRSKALNKIKQYFRYRHCMTGTPNSNGITDLWNIVNILDDGQRLGTSFYSFRAHTCEATQVGPQANMIKWTDRPGIEQIVSALINDITIRHKFEDCIDIPENVLRSINYYMPVKQLNVYEQMRDAAVAEIRAGKLIDAVNAAAVTTKLLQICSGAVYDGQGGYEVVDRSRYELVADLVEERKHSIVFFLWAHQRDLLIEEFKSRGITFAVIDGNTPSKMREEAVKHFQSGFYRVLLAHPQSAAHGLTLTRGTSTIWASPTYNLEHFLQGNRRIYRAGQKEKTETLVVISPGTIEEHVLVRLEEKNVRQIDLLEMLECSPNQTLPSIPTSSP